MSYSVEMSQASVGPLPRLPAPPVPARHHGCRGGDKSSKPLLPKKERLRLGREKDKRRVQDLRTQLQALASSSDDDESCSDDLKLEIKRLRHMLSASVLRAAAIRAAQDAATAGALRLGSSADQAELLADHVRQALVDLAPATTPGNLPDGAEAVASAAYGLGNNMTTPGAEAVASAANDLGNSLCGSGEDESRPHAYDIFDAEDTLWQAPDAASAACYHRAVVDVTAATSQPASDGADFAAGAHRLECAHPEPLLSTAVVKGGGSPITTPKEPSTSSTTSALSSSSSMATLLAAHPSADCAASCAPGSSNPGAQNGAASDFSLDLTSNDINEVTYCVTHLRDTGATQCGPFATVHDKHGFTNISGVCTTSATSVAKQVDDIESKFVAAALNGNLKDSNSHNLANTCGHLLTQCGPSQSNTDSELSDAIADDGGLNDLSSQQLASVGEILDSASDAAASDALDVDADTTDVDKDIALQDSGAASAHSVYEVLSPKSVARGTPRFVPCGSFGQIDDFISQNLANTACAETTCGPPDASPAPFDATSGTDFNSQTLAKSSSSSGPFGTVKDFKSQELDEQSADAQSHGSAGQCVAVLPPGVGDPRTDDTLRDIISRLQESYDASKTAAARLG